MRDLWISILVLMALAAAVSLVRCSTYHSTIGPYHSTIGAWRTSDELTDAEAGYNQEKYDECMDSPDTTAAQCESVGE